MTGERPRPLRNFDYQLVGSRLDGLFLNIDRELQKRVGAAIQRSYKDSERQLTVLLVLFRFARNSYQSVQYLTASFADSPPWKQNYVIVVPTIVRQLLDLLCSLAYMMDDFPTRSLEYQRSGWRQHVEEIEHFENHFASDPEWMAFLDNGKQRTALMVDRFKITEEEQSNRKLVGYWLTPFQMLKTQTACLPFLEYLVTWVYKDVSSQAHLGFAGLLKVSQFFTGDLMGDEARPEGVQRQLQSYHFHQVSLTAITFLAIATEIDTHCNLGKKSDIDYLWVIFGEYSKEAKELYELRYQNRPIRE